MRVVSGDDVCDSKSSVPTGRLWNGALSFSRTHRLWNSFWNSYTSDIGIQHLMGCSLLIKKLGPHRRSAAASRGVSFGRAQHVRGRSHHGREQAEDVPAADGSHLAGVHVPHVAPLRNERPQHPARSGRVGAHGVGHRRLQDEAVGPHPRDVADVPQPVPERVVDHSLLQADAGLPQIRLLSDHVRDRRAAHDRFPRTRRSFYGRAQEKMVNVNNCCLENDSGKEKKRLLFQKVHLSPSSF